MAKKFDLSTVEPTVVTAAQAFIKLQERKENPSGSFDNAGRFWLAETCECCRSIRTPSRAFPYSQMVHARTAVHVANAYGVDASLVRKAANLLKKQS